jgi:hypothetical protein
MKKKYAFFIVILLCIFSFFLGKIYESTFENNSNIIDNHPCKDSSNHTKSNYLLVDKIKPFVVNGYDKLTNTYTKEVFLCIQKSKGAELKLLLGTLDTNNYELIDTSLIFNSKPKNDYNSFKINNVEKDEEIEGLLYLEFPNQIISFPFSEKHNKWWDAE